MQAQYISRTLLVVGFSLNHRDSCMLFAAAQSFPLYSRLTGSGGGRVKDKLQHSTNFYFIDKFINIENVWNNSHRNFSVSNHINYSALL